MRLWRSDGRKPPARRGRRPGLVAAGSEPGRGLTHTTEGPGLARAGRRAHPVVWLELAGGDPRTSCDRRRPRVVPVVAALLESERQRAYVAEELAGRYEEIDLLYAISEILGRTVRLEEAAQIIVREVSAVVGARRASIMVYDEASRHPSNRRGPGLRRRGSGSRWRWMTMLGGGPGLPRAADRDLRSGGSGFGHHPRPVPTRGYRGNSFISVPICYAAPRHRASLRRSDQPDRPDRRRPLHPGRPQAGERGGQPDRGRGGERPAGRA